MHVQTDRTLAAHKNVFKLHTKHPINAYIFLPSPH